VNVLGTIVFDLGRFGIQYVASPRHADGLLITGPVTENMKAALKKTYDAVPSPKIVIAVGACAISGGPYAGHEEQHNGAASVVPIDLFIPGCPPHPLTILDGLLSLLDRIGTGVWGASPQKCQHDGESRRQAQAARGLQCTTLEKSHRGNPHQKAKSTMTRSDACERVDGMPESSSVWTMRRFYAHGPWFHDAETRPEE
jgi:Ni,Fe-hydrogenase III small subunit